MVKLLGLFVQRAIHLQSVGEYSWKVKCNSESFFIIRRAHGQVSVTVSVTNEGELNVSYWLKEKVLNIAFINIRQDFRLL